MTEFDLINYVNGWRGSKGITGAAVLNETQLTQFVLDLQSKVSEFSVRPGAGWAADASPIAYSGVAGSSQTFQIAKNISTNSGGELFYISDTPAGKLLNSTPLRDAVGYAAGGGDLKAVTRNK